jgi:membrane protease subunit (stomatin/prohibitin family)
MGLFSKFRNELIDIIEWPDNSGNILVHRFDRKDNEIKWGAKLVVREGQRAVFVSEGKIADSFEPGTYELKTKNLPVLRTLLSWKYGFESPFKAEVYFIKATEQLDRKWGTPNPVMLRDSDFGIVRLRARGNYSYKVGITENMISRFVGARPEFSMEDIEGQVRTKLISVFSDSVAESKISALDLAANYDELGTLVRSKLESLFNELGLKILSFAIENITLPEEVEKAMDERSSMGAIGNLNNYSQFQTAKAVREAAANESGSAGNLMGMMVGAQLGGNIGNATNPAQQSGGATVSGPPPLPSRKEFYVAVNGEQTGPFGINEINLKVANGELTEETLVWKEGMSNWLPAGEVSELKTLFSRTPPPLPPR